jgi:hypothetical protein
MGRLAFYDFPILEKASCSFGEGPPGSSIPIEPSVEIM